MTRGRWWLLALQILLLVLIAWFVYRELAPELRKLSREDLSRYRPALAPLLGSTLLLLSVYTLHALLWRHVTAVLGGRRVPLRAAMHVYFVSSLGRYLPGKLWQIAGLAMLAQRAGIPAVAATAASLLGQLAFMTMGLVLLALLLPASYGAPAMLGAIVLLLFGVVLFLLGSTSRGKELRHRLLARVGPRVAEAGTLLDHITARRAAIWWLAYGLSWLMLGTAFALFVSAFAGSFNRQFAYFAGTVAASYLVGTLSPLPGGAGVREISMVALLTAAIGAPAAVVVSIASRVWFTAGEILPLALIPLLPRDRAQETIP